MKLSRRGFVSAVAAGLAVVPMVKKARAEKPAADAKKPDPKTKQKIVWIGHSA